MPAKIVHAPWDGLHVGWPSGDWVAMVRLGTWVLLNPDMRRLSKLMMGHRGNANALCVHGTHVCARWLEQTLWAQTFQEQSIFHGMGSSGETVPWDPGDWDAYCGFHPLLAVWLQARDWVTREPTVLICKMRIMRPNSCLPHREGRKLPEITSPEPFDLLERILFNCPPRHLSSWANVFMIRVSHSP